MKKRENAFSRRKVQLNSKKYPFEKQKKLGVKLYFEKLGGKKNKIGGGLNCQKKITKKLRGGPGLVKKPNFLG